jgi:putative tryptophan/tyrosine transport system substrate-binding protein
MNRRAFVTGLGAVLAAPLVAEAQPVGKAPTVGFLGMSRASASPYFGYFRDGLRDLGWVEGRNVVIEYRSADGDPARFSALAYDLVKSRVDVILALVPAAVFATKKATQSIPIVMVATPDPVELGLVASLARPGGNITGLTTLSSDMSAKQLDLIRQLVPNASRIAVVSNPTNPWHPNALRLIETNGRTLGVRVQILSVRRPGDFEGALAEAAKEGPGALLVLADPMTIVYCAELADLAVKRRLPAMCPVPECVAAGCLASYWPNLEAMNRRAAWYVHRILSGAKPADLPIEQPNKFDLTINQKTAKVLGLTIPPSLLLRADQVIE